MEAILEWCASASSPNPYLRYRVPRAFNKAGTSRFKRFLDVHKRPRLDITSLESFIIDNTALSFSSFARTLIASFLLRMVAGQTRQLNGTITVGLVTTNMVTVTVTNEGVHNYSVLAKNNTFDNNHPFAPFTIATSAGTAVPLAGSRFDYGNLNDAQFMSFPPATVWTRQFNVSGFLLPEA